MASKPSGTMRHLPFIVVIATAIVVTASQANFTADSVFAVLSKGDNDDIMRFLSVRSWLEGQGWFDMTQYGVLAPDGISLHWSRYIDLMIASLVSAADLVVPTETAEAFALVFWPLSLFLVLVLVTAFGARRIFNPQVAIFAVLSLITWPIFLENYFMATRVDHHNVQILLLTVLIFSLAQRTPSSRLGVIGGLAAAFSLAVGLEAALAIGLAGLFLGVRAARDPDREGPQLVAFLSTATIVGAALFLGQTPADEYVVPYCDELSPPFLALLAAGAVLAWGFHAWAPRIQRFALRLALLIGCAIVGGVVAFALLEHCREGPYGDLPQSVRDIIHTQIVEARSAVEALLAGERYVYINLVPVLTVVVFAPLAWLARKRSQSADGAELRAVSVFFAFSLLGLLGMLSQLRFVVLAAAAVPTLTGYVLYALFDRLQFARSKAVGAAALAVVLSLTLLFPWTQSAAFSLLPAPRNATDGQRDVWASDCLDPDDIGQLNQYPAGVVLAPDPIGSSLLLMTDHTIIAAPYHRSAVAMGSIDIPFRAPEAEFRAMIRSHAVNYVVMCKLLSMGPNESFFRTLAMGTEATGFERLELPEDSPLVAYRVVD